MKNTKSIKPFDILKNTIDQKIIYFVLICSLLISVTIVRSLDIANFIGIYLISIIAISIMFMDIFRYKPSYLKQQKMIILLGLMFFGTLVFGRLIEYIFINFTIGLGLHEQKTIIYGLPVQAGAMLVMLLFDPHTAIIFSFIISILSGIWQNDAYYTFYVFAGSIIAAFSVIRCKKRSDIIKGGLYVSIANVISVIVFSMFSSNRTLGIIVPSLIFAMTSGITISAFTSIMLPILESIFKVTTDITLLELLDLNQPLMKNLMINAPGTYHHSVIVGNLVEAAAEDIGVNPLLARVSAYYHDIGKIKMPEYFVENQSGSISKHEKLTPHMSSMILISHVKEGLELADEYKLPELVKDIITQHHGTHIITYFYQKAKEEQSDPPKEEDYRYPGPKPQNRIAAIVMIADAVEAASRVLKDSTPARVSGLVEKIINTVLIDGQLTECELTLKDIHKIKERFTFILIGILHKRIEYPGFDFNKGAKKEGEQHKNVDRESQQKEKDKPALDQTPGGLSPNVIKFTKGGTSASKG
ncbi:HD family phosphohydrolase [Candidatus Magnetominusculus xianensis]|uniref:Domain HDIG n=1 Tax=Candidatus Magnetominusculus xianensis TaxID=1748249 RepID=A0ABR5SIG0_9BACT|nr:HDIG domain-containing metalloprotein [Candidatus Magnetominusculus xianensis]KWT92685.1 putative domain HDIG [Candidatus Magnetominusculus xianensis]MBF0403764.1 HDIG domain-containing protein [Nitrospirota bacterium]